MAEEKQENTKDNTQPEKKPSTDTQTQKDDRKVYLMFIAKDNDYIIDKHIVAQGWPDHDMTFWFQNKNIDKELNTYCENIKMGKDTNFKTVFTCLLSKIKPKDIIIAKYRSKFYICEIPENYTFYYNKNLSNDYKQGLYPVNWIKCPEKIKEEIGEIKPNFYIKHYNDTNDKIKKLWDTNKKNYNNKVHDKETDEILSSEPKRKNESFKLYINGINMKIIEEKADLLQNVKNLVLTGAPGTGKTHLARQIAEKIVKGNLTNLFNEKSKSTNTNTINEIIEKWNIYKQKINNKKLTIDEYSIAKELNPDNLAYFIKYGSDEYSNQSSGVYYDWGIYKDKNGKYINLNGEVIQEKDAQDIFTKIKEILAAIFSKNSAEDMLKEIQKIQDDDNSLIRNYACLIKMVVLCFPKDFIPIIKDDSLNQCLNLLNIPYTKDDFLNNNTRLVKYLKDNIKEDINENDIITWQIVLLDDNTKEKIESFIRTVQFHPSYDYTDFVEGLRPYYINNNNSQDIGFELKKGTFLEFCEKAATDKQKNGDKANKYVFIIDEINRGEISKIFGEIFAAIEPGYRGNTKQKFQTQYANMHNYSNGFENSPFKDGFYVPDNLYIIGTMNDIDRSVESFDFALRRRFTWTEITAESQAIVMWTANELDFDLNTLQNRMNNLNKKIEEIPGLSKDYHIGPAYFSKLKDYPKDEAYDKLWKNHLEPLLKEYLRGMENIDTNIGILKEAYNNEN